MTKPAFIEDRKVAWFNSEESGKSGEGWVTPVKVVETYEEANLILSSTTNGNEHLPVFDLDFPCKLVPSRTEGHFHLYMNVPVEWEAFLKVLEAMVDAGLIEKGYYEASKTRGFTAARVPKESTDA